MAAVLMAVSAATDVQAETIDGLNYTLNSTDMTATVGSNKKASGVVNIPQTVTYDGAEYTVTAIAAEAFGSLWMSGASGMTTVIIPETVKSIGDYAFGRCNGLFYCYILSPDATIGKSIFYSCWTLSTVYTVEGHGYTTSSLGLSNAKIVTGKYYFDEDGNIAMKKDLAEFSDEEPYNNSVAYMAKTATYTRNGVKAGYWCSLCLPFDCPVPDGVTVEEYVERKSSTVVVFAKVGEIKAGQAYIFKSVTDGDITFTGNDVLLDKNTNIEDVNMNGTFVGVLRKKLTIQDFSKLLTHYIYGINPEANKFQRLNELGDNTTTRCLPYHAFLQFSKQETSSAAMRVAHSDDGITSIDDNMTAFAEEAGRTAIYNLKGQRLAAPQKGICIINGKKALIK